MDRTNDDAGVPGEDDLIDGGLSLPDEIFEVDGDTTGADPDADDPAVNIRPHDIDISTVPTGAAGASAGYVIRMLRIGFEVRVTVLTEDGDEVVVVLTKTHARAIGLEQDVKVWLTPAVGATVVPAMRPVG